MNSPAGPPSASVLREPWFRRHPGLALSVAGVLFAAVFLLCLPSDSPGDASTMLYVLPVALVAITAGLRPGTGSGLVAVALTALWALAKGVTLTPIEWAWRVAPILVLGVLLGHATDRLRNAQLECRRLEAAATLHREAIEINDTLVQGMVAATWAFDAGRTDSGKAILDQTILQAQELVSALIRRADMGTRSETLRATPDSPPPSQVSRVVPTASDRPPSWVHPVKALRGGGADAGRAR